MPGQLGVNTWPHVISFYIGIGAATLDTIDVTLFLCMRDALGGQNNLSCTDVVKNGIQLIFCGLYGYRFAWSTILPLPELYSAIEILLRKTTPEPLISSWHKASYHLHWARGAPSPVPT